MRRIRVRVLSVDMSESGMSLVKALRAEVLMRMINLYLLYQ